MFQSKPNLYKVIKGKVYTSGSRVEEEPEKVVSELSFKKYKFNNRPLLGRRKTVIFPCFSEFGSLTLMPVYIIPYFMQERYSGKYSIVCCWEGLSYLFKHVVDEVWELDSSFNYLKEYCRAFHHDSRTLKKCERYLSEYGKLVDYNNYGGFAVSELYKNIDEYKKKACWVPEPSREKIDRIKSILKPNSVGISPRGRKCYGRNLTPEFYSKLIVMLKDMGYNPVWIGDNTILKNFDSSVLDYSSLPESKDIEYTFALTKCLEFGLQWYTASTRLYTMMGRPTILFESDQQVLKSGSGQEHYRLKLLSKENNLKLVVAHYNSVLENPDLTLKVTEQAIREVKECNYNVIVPDGLVNNKQYIEFLLK